MMDDKKQMVIYISFFKAATPEFFHLFGQLVFGRISLSVPDALVQQLFGQVILFDEVIFVIMGILIFFPII